MKNSILVATDFSDSAKHATEWAADFAVYLGYDLLIYHCYHIPILATDIPFPTGAEVMVEDGLIKLMNQEVERIKNSHLKLNVNGKVEPGFTNDSINEFAITNKVSYIVLGIAGKSSFEKRFVGSTASSVALHAQLPVIIVPSVINKFKLDKLAVAIDKEGDFNDSSFSAIFHVCENSNTSLDFIHINNNNTQEIKTSVFTEKFTSNFNNMKFYIHEIADADIDHGIKGFVKENNIDLMIIVHKKHPFFERLFKRSHTGTLAFEVNVPLLVLHEK